MKKIRRQLILAISMIFLALVVCSAAAAAEVSDNGTAIQTQNQVANYNSINTNSVQTSTTNTISSQANTSNTDSEQTDTTEQPSNPSSTETGSSQVNAIEQPSKVVISGKVTKCSSGEPFPGATVTAQKDGTALASATTDEDGNYTLEFPSDDRDFIVTASYLGHTSSSKEVTVIPDANGTLQGSANFQLGPADGDKYVFNGWAVDPNQVITFPDGTSIDGNDPAAFDNIADAVNAATPGRTVYIADGDGPYVGPNNRGITINKNLNIVGESQTGTVIDAQGADRIFFIQSGNTVTIQNLTLTNGNSSFGGAMVNNGDLTINGCTFNDNSAGDGGAIWNTGDLTINGCTFNDNSAGDGGAIINFGDLTVEDCTFTGNTASLGGGAISNQEGTLTVNNSIFTGNKATNFDGGAIINWASMTVTGSTFDNNTANQNGGAITNLGTLNITNSTLNNNTATLGGAIYNRGTLNVTGSNFESNTAHVQGGAICYYGGYANVHFNRIVGNNPSNSEVYSQFGTMDATLNWWGSNTSPAGKISTGTGGVVLFDPWLVLSITANPTTIFNRGTSQVTADLLHDSNGVYHNPALGHVPDGIPITLTTDWSSFTNPGITHSITLGTVNGSVTATFFANEGPTPQPPLNPVEITATADDQNVSMFITILPPPPQRQTQNQTQTQTSINTNTNSITNNNTNTAISTSSAVNTNIISNANTFNPVIRLINLNRIGF